MILGGLVGGMLDSQHLLLKKKHPSDDTVLTSPSEKVTVGSLILGR